MHQLSEKGMERLFEAKLMSWWLERVKLRLIHSQKG
jgi:hypothetical protein